MNQIETILENYTKKEADFRKERERIQTKIGRIEKQVERLNKKLKRAYDARTSWVDEIIKPIAVLLAPFFPERRWEIYGPFGLVCSVSIHFYKNGVSEDKKFDGKNCLSITFRPGNLQLGELLVVDYRKNLKEYPKGSIGEMNGMNHPAVEMKPDTKWLVGWVKRGKRQ
jgi:hypothetical protein